MRHDIEMTVNGEKLSIEVVPRDVLLDVLRSRLGIKSPKIGCERGDCGACTVLIDGKTIRSCLVLAVEADGHEVTTVEGIEHAGLTAVQETMIEQSAFQCGFCAPGIVVVAAELVGRNPHPTAGDVREAIAGNLCRCTGYESIVEAVVAATTVTRSRAGGEA
ncbi:MAG TPA: (2Fe-2S)-binding protein [Acidimicrobiia bacterium]|jgi:carbon-monoxide dehydrogenase small subunit